MDSEERTKDRPLLTLNGNPSVPQRMSCRFDFQAAQHLRRRYRSLIPPPTRRCSLACAHALSKNQSKSFESRSRRVTSHRLLPSFTHLEPTVRGPHFQHAQPGRYCRDIKRSATFCFGPCFCEEIDPILATAVVASELEIAPPSAAGAAASSQLSKSRDQFGSRLPASTPGFDSSPLTAVR